MDVEKTRKGKGEKRKSTGKRRNGEQERDEKKYIRERDEEKEEEERRDGSCRGWKRTKTAQNTQTGVLQ